MTNSDACMRSGEVARALSLSQPDAFALWVAETLAEEADRANDVYELDLRATVIDSTIIVSGTACLDRFIRDCQQPAKALKRHIERRFGEGHPLSKALIVWSVNCRQETPALADRRFSAAKPVCASAHVCLRNDPTASALQVIAAGDARSEVYLVADACVDAQGTVRVALHSFNRPTRFAGYETALLSSFGRAGWSTQIAGLSKHAPERIAYAFAHYAADVIVKTGFTDACTVTVRSAPGSARIDAVSVCLNARGAHGLEDALSKEISQWDIRYETLYRELRMNSVDLREAFESGRFGRAPQFRLPVREAPFVQDSPFFKTRAPIFKSVAVRPDEGLRRSSGAGIPQIESVSMF